MVRKDQLSQDVFNNKKFYQKMLVLALPVMVQNLILSLLNLIDTIMVGKLGEVEIAAVGIANQYFFFFNMFLIGLSAGCSIFISQFWGKRDIASIRRILGVGLISITIVSLVFIVFGFLNPPKLMALFNNDPEVINLGVGYLNISLVSYLFTGITFVYSFSLRSIGNAVQPMLISVFALVCNAFLNYVFIYGNLGAPALGVEGAALATLIARVAESVILVASIYVGKGVLAASARQLFDFTFEFVIKAYRTIFPVILNDMCWGLASLVYVAVYGRMGTQEVAAVQICNTINNLFLVVAVGMSGAAAVMIGNSVGAGKEWLTRKYAGKFSSLSVEVGIILGLLVAFASPVMLSFFNVSDTVKNISQIILIIISVIFFLRTLGIMLIVGVLRGGGDAKNALIIEGFTMWFIGVPLTVLGAFVFQFPVYIVYGLAVLEELAKCILALLRLKSGRWIKNVTYNMTYKTI